MDDAPRTREDVLGSIYNRLANEEDLRSCRDIPESACREVPRNFFLIIISNTLTKLGDELANPKTVLAWLMTFVGAPAALLGLLVPLRESGSMVPALLIAAWVRQVAVRKWVWVLGSVVQGLAIGGIGLVAFTLTGALAGWLILGCVLVFALARGLCSVSYKDVLGKTIPKQRRGLVAGYAAGVSGVLALAAGVVLIVLRSDGSPAFYGGLIAGAAGLWFLGAAVYATIAEYAGATEGGKNAIHEAFSRFDLLRTDAHFRRFVLVRALMLATALAAPYYVALGQEAGEGQAWLLGAFVVAGGLASSISAPVWGRQADISSRRVIIAGGALAAALGIVLPLLHWTLPVVQGWPLAYALAFLVLGVAHSGVRLGRKTYVVDMAVGNQRTDYVAVSNTVIGLLLLVTGAIGALAPYIGSAGMILLYAALAIGACAVALGLPEVEQAD